MSKCQGSWFGRHKFEPRYDRTLPKDLAEGGFEGTRSTIEAVKDQIYVRDICVRCSETVEKRA